MLLNRSNRLQTLGYLYGCDRSGTTNAKAFLGQADASEPVISVFYMHLKSNCEDSSPVDMLRQQITSSHSFSDRLSPTVSSSGFRRPSQPPNPVSKMTSLQVPITDGRVWKIELQSASCFGHMGSTLAPNLVI